VKRTAFRSTCPDGHFSLAAVAADRDALPAVRI
jgi:hypothetical protein